MEIRHFDLVNSSLSDVKINPGMPLYENVKQQILQKIADGHWNIEAALPNEKLLSQQFQVSIGTLRKAVGELVSSGVLVRQQGRGTFVAKHCDNRYLFNFFHIVARNSVKEHPKMQLLEIQTIKAKETIARNLQISYKSSVIRLKNLLFLQKRPVILDVLYLPAAIFPKLNEQSILERKGTLYQLYQEQCNISIIRTDERLCTTTADPEKAKWLKVATGSTLLHITRVARSLERGIVELRYSFVNTKHHDYSARHFG